MKQLLTLILLLVFQNTEAQKEACNWLFANHCFVSFATGTPVQLQGCAINSSMFYQEGCSSVSDAQGNLLFYADGPNVYNNLHQIMPNGSGLNGHPSATQAALIVKKPLSTTEYYVFTTERDVDTSNGLWYSIIDISLDGGLGDVSVKNVRLATAMSEKQTAIRHSNNQDYWLITHKKSENKFLSFRVTSTGIDTIPFISITGITPVGYMGVGCLKSNFSGNKLASAYYEMSNSIIQTYSFDRTTGEVTYNSATDILYNQRETYSCAFSPSGQYLYVSQFNPKKILQFDLTQNTQPPVLIAQTLNPCADLVLAPDAKIYIAQHNYPFLSAIHFPNNQGISCGFDSTAIFLNGNITALGLPNFPNDLTTISSVENLVSEEFKIYPNAVSDELNIIIPEQEGEVLLSIIDVLGSVIQQVKLKESKCQLNLIGMATGFYLVKLQSRNKRYVAKIIKW